mmetsp:Transcript_686/g.1079  ORF Transcript_686/g.1079 Transcript_686/m.1079 type:complete len:239 (-) Transcript_686:41-757(-)
MKLSKEQVDLLKSLSTDYHHGLRSNTDHNGYDDESEYNMIPPPINCPNWACILLPCINHIPSMKLYKAIKPTEAEVRKNSRWIIYDAVSIGKGDIIRLGDGDIVPADVVVLNLGMDFVTLPDYGDDEDEDDNKEMEGREKVKQLLIEELVVDSSNVNGYTKPQTVTVDEDTGMIPTTELYAGSVILQGDCIAVVTKTGQETLLASLMKKGDWPPKRQVMGDGDDGEATIALVEQSEVI